MTVERVAWRGRNVFISGAGRVAHSDRAVETASCDDLKCIGLLDLDRAFPTAARHSLLPPVQMPLSGRCSASSLRADPSRHPAANASYRPPVQPAGYST